MTDAVVLSEMRFSSSLMYACGQFRKGNSREEGILLI